MNRLKHTQKIIRFLPVFIPLVILLTACGNKRNRVIEDVSGAKDKIVHMIKPEPGRVEDAVLYRLSDDFLEYNVTHAAKLGETVAIWGKDVDSPDDLGYVLGDPDRPQRVFGTECLSRDLKDAVRADLIISDDGTVTSIHIKDISPRPIIGLSWQGYPIPDFYMDYAEAFERGGAKVVFLPQLNSEEEAVTALNRVDGVFVTGGEDWNPATYGETATPYGAEGWNDPRDTSDWLLIEQAIKMDMPMLCTCRSMQGLNIVLGGGLIQDIPSYLGSRVTDGVIDRSRVTSILSGESEGEDGDPFRVWIDNDTHIGGYHGIYAGMDGLGVSKKSKWLYDILNADSIEVVHSSHHQAIDPERLGSGLTIVASSSDGIVEAVEYQENTFALGVQWHPENDAVKNTIGVDIDQDQCNAVLGALIKYASLRKGQGED